MSKKTKQTPLTRDVADNALLIERRKEGNCHESHLQHH
jgi:hypothetical protein